MRDTRFYISAAVFLALTLFKILLPELVFEMREDIVRQLDRNIDYEAVVATVGRKVNEYAEKLDLMDLGIRRTAPESPPPSEAPGSPSVEPKAPLPSPSAAPLPTPSPIPLPSPQTDARILSASETLPFEHSAPVAVSVSSGFGNRLHPIEGVEKFHYGTDLSADEGDAIRAFADGEIIKAEFSDSYGNYIVLRHDEAYETIYAHCSKLLVKPGDKVTIGQEIARVGHTGNATGPHLHFELRKDGVCIDPEAYLA